MGDWLHRAHFGPPGAFIQCDSRVTKSGIIIYLWEEIIYSLHSHLDQAPGGHCPFNANSHQLMHSYQIWNRNPSSEGKVFKG